MITQEMVEGLVNFLVKFSTDMLMPTMGVLFIVGVVLRGLIYFTVKREYWFAREFEKRVHEFMDESDDRGEMSFFILTKHLLEKTYYELFTKRALHKRRNSDFIMSMSDRVFLIQHGVAILVRDTLKQIKYLKHTDHIPKLKDISKNVFSNNASFSRVFGIIPASLFNDVLNILPGIFIISGIFGTFLGIMAALPELGTMDLADPAGAKLIMDKFLVKISFSMSSSILGIVLSVTLTVINTTTSPEKLFISIVDRFENSLDILWNRSTDNRLPEDIPEFDEHRDPIEVLATKALEEQLAKDKAELRKKKEQLKKISA
ncbi:MAG: hypothetical protein R2827_07035 [Bdellovibrionales bacterium]